MEIKPKVEILVAMLVIGIIAVMVILYSPQNTVEVAGAAVTGIGMLGMKLVEKQ